MTINSNNIEKNNTGRAMRFKMDVRKAIASGNEIAAITTITMVGRGMAILGKNKFVSPIYLVRSMHNIVTTVIRMPGQFFCKVRVSGGDVNAQETAAKIIVAVGSQKVML